MWSIRYSGLPTCSSYSTNIHAGEDETEEALMRTYLITTVLFGGLTLLVVGCTDHYRVTDPMSGKSYYTTKVDNAGRGGAVKIKDEKSGSIVTLQSSEVKTISEEEYEAAMVANAPVQPAPVPPAAVRSATPPAGPAQP